MANTGDGNVYIALYNLNAFADRVDVRWSDLGFNNATAVRDIWSQTDLGAFQGGFSTMVLGHGARLLKVTPDGSITPMPTGQIYEAEAATLTGSASVSSCTACSGGKEVGNIGHSNTVVFNNVNATAAGTYRMEIDSATQGPRSLEYSVNGAPAATLNLSGGSYVPAPEFNRAGHAERGQQQPLSSETRRVMARTWIASSSPAMARSRRRPSQPMRLKPRNSQEPPRLVTVRTAPEALTSAASAPAPRTLSPSPT